MLPNAARYQLRYTPIVIKLWSCKWSNLWSGTVLTVIFCFPYRPKSARLKGFLRFSLSCGAKTVYAPKCGALPTAPHPVVLCFLVCFLLIDFLLSIRGASLRNIVAALRLERSLRSLFLHLGAMPSSATSGGIPPRPTAPHPVVLCFLVCFLLIDFLLSIRGASLRNIVAAL